MTTANAVTNAIGQTISGSHILGGISCKTDHLKISTKEVETHLFYKETLFAVDPAFVGKDFNLEMLMAHDNRTIARLANHARWNGERFPNAICHIMKLRPKELAPTMELWTPTTRYSFIRGSIHRHKRPNSQGW